MDTRRLLLGDWTPVVRDGIDLLRVAPLVGAGVLALRGDGGGAAVLALCGALALLGRAASLPRLLDLAFVLALNVQGWGEALGAYDRFAWFDEAAHAVIPALAAPVAYVALARLKVVPDLLEDHDRGHRVGIVVVTLSLGLALGAIWEMLEWVADTLWDAGLQEGNTDTVTDLTLDGAGALVGGGLLLLWTVRGWGTTRRIPGTNEVEATATGAPVGDAAARERQDGSATDQAAARSATRA